MAEYRSDCDPIRTFLLEHYEPSEAYGTIASSDLYAHYTRYCQQNGYQPVNNANFGKSVKRIFPEVQKKKSGPRHQQVVVYTGLISLQPQP